MIIGYVVTYVHIVTSDFHDIGHEKNPYRAALVANIFNSSKLAHSGYLCIYTTASHALTNELLCSA